MFPQLKRNSKQTSCYQPLGIFSFLPVQNSLGRRKGRCTSKKWDPVQGGLGLRNKSFLVNPLLLAFRAQGMPGIQQMFINYEMTPFLTKKSQVSTQFQCNQLNRQFFKKEFGTTPLLPSPSFHAVWLHLSLLILLFSFAYFLFSEVPEFGSKPVHTYLLNLPMITVRFSNYYFASFFLFLFSLSKFHHLFVSSCYILYFLNKIS